MKKLIFALFLLPIVAFSQSVNKSENILRKDSTSVNKSKTSIINRTYTSSTIDTSVVYNAVDWKNIYVAVQSKDSARIHIKYQLSSDGSTFGLLTTKDSLSTTQAAGDLKTVDLTSTILGSPYFRLIFDCTVAGVAQGTTTNTYTAVLTRKQD